MGRGCRHPRRHIEEPLEHLSVLALHYVRQQFPMRPFRSIRPVAFGAALALVFFACRSDPVFGPLRGTDWVIVEETIDSMEVVQSSEVVQPGGSRTLYAGQIPTGAARESAILLKFQLIESALLDTMVRAELLLFRRGFQDSIPDPVTRFEMAAIVADTTIWAELDSALAITDFPDTLLPVWGFMNTDPIVLDGADSTLGANGVEHLALSIPDSLLRTWSSGDLVNNGIILRQVGGSGLTVFNAREADLNPRVMITYIDSNGTEAYLYRLLLADLSIYPPSGMALPNDVDLFSLNYSEGWRVSINFSDQFIPDSSEIILTARLILTSPQVPVDLVSNVMHLEVGRAASAVGDSAVSAQSSLIYKVEQGTAVFSMGLLLDGYNSSRFDNHGIIIAVAPNQHDFDTIQFYNSAADPSVRPRLELVIGRSFQELP